MIVPSEIPARVFARFSERYRFVPPPGFPPGPSETPLEQLRAFAAGPNDFYRDAARRFGPVFTVRLLGQEPWVIVGEPSLVRQIFRASSDEFLGDADGIKYLLGAEAILFKDGEEHRRERRALTPPFKHHRMMLYAPTMARHADEALDGVTRGQRLVARDFVAHFTLRTIVECVFGVSDDAMRERLVGIFAEHMHDSQHAFMMATAIAVGGDRFRGWLLEGTRIAREAGLSTGKLPRAPFLRYFAVRAAVADMLAAELGKLRANPDPARDDVLSMLARTTYDDGRPMSDASVLDELFALLIGGHETSAITLSWVLYYLALHPDAQARARDEVRTVFPTGEVDPKEVDRLAYVTAVIDEAMRMAPVAASVPRRLAEGVKLEGYDLPAGTRTFPSPAVLHYREDLWPEPHEFRPTRFLGQRPSPFEYLPFGGGSRACLGRPFAMMQMRIVLARLLDRLEYRLADDAAPKQAALGILTGPSDGVPIVVESVSPRRHGSRTTGAHAA